MTFQVPSNLDYWANAGTGPSRARAMYTKDFMRCGISLNCLTFGHERRRKGREAAFGPPARWRG